MCCQNDKWGIARFLRSEKGAVTAEYTVLLAGAVTLALAATSSISTSTIALSEKMATSIGGTDVSAYMGSSDSGSEGGSDSGSDSGSGDGSDSGSDGDGSDSGSNDGGSDGGSDRDGDRGSSDGNQGNGFGKDESSGRGRGR